MTLLTTSLFALLTWLLSVALTPIMYVVWYRWQRHERAALGPKCSQGYDYEYQPPTEDERWINEIETMLAERSADD